MEEAAAAAWNDESSRNHGRRQELLELCVGSTDIWGLDLNVKGLGRYNHDHGHDAGDEVLRRLDAAVGSVLQPGEKHAGGIGGGGRVLVAVRGDRGHVERRARQLLEACRVAVDGLVFRAELVVGGGDGSTHWEVVEL